MFIIASVVNKLVSHPLLVFVLLLIVMSKRQTTAW